VKYYTVICLERLRKTEQNFSHDSRFLGRDLNPRRLEYEVEMLTSQGTTSAVGTFCTESVRHEAKENKL